MTTMQISSSGCRRSRGRPLGRAVGVAGVVAGLVLGGLSVPSAAAVERLTRSPWQMHTEPAPHTLGTPGGSHGAESAYGLASIPAVDDPGWTPAPDGDVIKFDGTVPGLGGRDASRLSGCNTQVDYTYFQTLVTVPVGGTVDTFTVNFDGIDDGARITIFNPANPGGVVVPGSYVMLGGSGTKDLAAYVGQGANRVVITQLDDCAGGNTLREASIVLNGTVVAVNRLTVLGAPTVASPWGASVTAPVASVTSTDPSISSTDLSGTIDWGDGTPATAGTLSGVAGGPFTVTGTHTYATAGSYTIVTKVDHPAQPLDTGTASTPADIQRRPLTVTAGDVSRPYGAPNPEIPASYSGFFGTDTAAVLTTRATCTSAAAVTSTPGTYTTTCAGATDENYTFTYAPGTLVVLKAATELIQSPVSLVRSLLGLKITYTAVLTNKATGTGIAGEHVRLSAGGPLGGAIGACTATTDSTGKATCSGLVLGVVPALLGFSTVASYGGSDFYLGSTDSTAVKVLD
jgi:hypothetical protein